MNIRKSLIDTYLECLYIKKRLQLRLSKKISGGGYIDNARAKLTEISPKPMGYYNGVCNKAVDDKVDLSIIVPVYNVEKYLAECLDSIVSQDTKFNYEVICVDDGSPDNSIDILYEYQKKYKCIKIIRQENRGLSGARNKGLDCAVGKYVLFIDSDDIISQNTIDILLDNAYESEHDIVSCGFYTFNQEGKVKDYPGISCSVNGQAYETAKKCHCYFWGKVFKRCFFADFRLPEGYLFEDMMMFHILTRKCIGFSHIALPLFGYRINPNGITGTSSTNKKALINIGW